MNDSLERQIQDYLDDRMSVADRRAFEGRLDDDAELARRVDVLREIGRALRDDAPDLAPAFYTQLLGRFEEERRRSVRWFRPLSWEVAGLATAAALLAVVFAPYLLDRGVPGIDAPASLEPVASPAPAADVEAEVGVERFKNEAGRRRGS